MGATKKAKVKKGRGKRKVVSRIIRVIGDIGMNRDCIAYELVSLGRRGKSASHVFYEEFWDASGNELGVIYQSEKKLSVEEIARLGGIEIDGDMKDDEDEGEYTYGPFTLG